jgi:hypothetical protein
MNDVRLREILNRLPIPVPSDSARARARHRALLALQLPGPGEPAQNEASGSLWSWRYVLVIAALVSVLALVSLRTSSKAEDVAGDRQILRQMQQLFPNQVDAVVVENGKVELSIAQNPTVGSDQPVVVVFKRGEDSIKVLSYSGHRICLALGGEHNCFDILATPAGGVILEAENQVWLSSNHPVVAGYSVRAQILGASL